MRRRCCCQPVDQKAGFRSAGIWARRMGRAGRGIGGKGGIPALARHGGAPQTQGKRDADSANSGLGSAPVRFAYGPTQNPASHNEQVGAAGACYVAWGEQGGTKWRGLRFVRIFGQGLGQFVAGIFCGEPVAPVVPPGVQGGHYCGAFVQIFG